jgi:hypothetical protein
VGNLYTSHPLERIIPQKENIMKKLSKAAEKYLRNFFIDYPPCSLKDLNKNTIQPFIENIESETVPGEYVLDREIVAAYKALHKKTKR